MYKWFITFFVALMTLSACEPVETDGALEAALVDAPQVSMVDASAHPESIPKRQVVVPHHSTSVEDHSDDIVVGTARVIENEEPRAPFATCSCHDDCSVGQFCGVECWTGDCGDDEDVTRGTRGQFCQPCDECVFGSDSITGDCSVCDE